MVFDLSILSLHFSVNFILKIPFLPFLRPLHQIFLSHAQVTQTCCCTCIVHADTKIRLHVDSVRRQCGTWTAKVYFGLQEKIVKSYVQRKCITLSFRTSHEFLGIHFISWLCWLFQGWGEDHSHTFIQRISVLPSWSRGYNHWRLECNTNFWTLF